MKNTEEMSLFTVRIISEYGQFVKQRKNNVERGVQAPDLAALEVKNYGYGLAKALTIAERLFQIPSSDMATVVDRHVLKINTTHIDTCNHG